MISLDTNVLIRLIVEDEPNQVAKARQIVLAHGSSLQMTVILEAAWVLKDKYGFSNAQIAKAFEVLSETENIETPPQLENAVEAARRGVEIADALHLVECSADRFATFDRRLIKRAPRAFTQPEVISP